ncbi:hypothetical protein Vqi01_56680 [Micromonospora qiuiae]|uniref:Uncharacterized protein n=1 Tax=Micromonospora qiuiae TaxID=502268 RepID=A0ABQ4JLR1_9ACTN|nr:hypothetical protein [Micromonospora qiuiae]GIJ30506.1 hypothetical protein Vqi01_56680 [Micromonospora qiuiae]
MDPTPGDVLHVDAAASVQFSGNRSLTFRVIKVGDRPTYDGWVWLTGYVLDRTGNAVARREIFVQRAGLKLLAPATVPAAKRTSPTAPGRVAGSGQSRKAPTTISTPRRLR